MRFALPVVALVVIAACGTQEANEPDVQVVAPPVTTLTYADVKPIFDARCVMCHGEKEPKEGISLNTYANVMKGGEKGPILVAGKASESALVHVIDGTEEPRMPFKQDPLSADEIKKIADWIDQGAKE
jgi:uncharacterized membrane protein